MSAGREAPSRGVGRVADAKARFYRGLVDLPHQQGAVAQMHEVLLSHVGRPPGEPCGAAMLVAPLGTGKTETIKDFVGVAGKGAPPGTRPVLHVTMRHECTPDAVATAILAALGASRPDAGKASFRWHKALRDVADAKVQAMVMDEFNRAASRAVMSRPIVEIIRERIMDPGVCPVIFVGSDEAETVLKTSPATLDRVEADIGLAPFDWTDPEDRQALAEFLKALDGLLVTERITDGPSGLDAHDLAMANASGGRLRPIKKVIRGAIGHMMADARTRIVLADLEAAYDEMPMVDRMAANPFRRNAK